MQFNVKKCHILRISRQHAKSIPTYTLGLETLSVVNSFTYLGVTISSDLRWNEHVATVVAKASRTLNFVRRNLYGCTPDVKAKAYQSLVRPQLEYAVAAWDPYTLKNIQQLESVQHRAARFVKHDYRYTTSVSGLLKDLGCPPPWLTGVEWPASHCSTRHFTTNLLSNLIHFHVRPELQDSHPLG